MKNTKRQRATGADVIEVVVLALIASLFLAGCIGGLRKTEVVKSPDSAMLIQSVNRRSITVGVYDAETNSIIEYGKIKLDDRHEGWTVSKFDWEKFINGRGDDEE